MKKRGTLIAVLTLVLVIGAGLGTALAYFTDSVTAIGDKTITMKDRARIEEPEPVQWTKHVTITAAKDSGPVYVRVRAFAGSDLKLTYPDAEANGWTKDGDWYYYEGILDDDDETPEPDKSEVIQIKINGTPETAKAGDTVDVIVVQEYTPVRYHEDGSPYADWSTTRTEGGD